MNDDRPSTTATALNPRNVRWRSIFALCLGLLGSLFFFVELVLMPIAAWTLYGIVNMYGWDITLRWMREEDRLDEFLVQPVIFLLSVGLLVWAYGLWKRQRHLMWSGFLLFVICAMLQSLIERWL